MAALQGLSDKIVLEASTFTIGRSPDNQLVMNDGKVSARHSVLQLLGAEYSITDLGSSNGTYLNEIRLTQNTPTTLKSGDKIRIGDTIYTYEGNQAVAPGYEPTMMASSAPPAYEATVMASPQQLGSIEQSKPATPAYPQYPAAANAAPAPTPPAYASQQGQPYQQPAYPNQQAQAYQQPAYPNQQAQPGQQPAYPNQQAQPGQQPAYAGQQGQPYQQPAYPNQQAQPYQQPAYPNQQGQAYPSQPGQPGQTYQQPGQLYQQSIQPGYVPPAPAKKGGSKTLIIVLVILLLLGGGGGGAAYYVLTRPQPTITVTSVYAVGSVPAGTTNTEIKVSGQKFSGNSAITFLLDGNPITGATTGHSDSEGALTTTLKITDTWKEGSHTLTAKDASGYVTAVGKAITIVTPGQAHTPGPNGAPSDDSSGDIVINFDASSGSNIITLTVTGKPEGGTVCRDVDDGKPHKTSGTSSGLAYVETVTASCEGTYKGGKLTYTETVSSDQVELEGGYVCVAQTPYVLRHLEGTFSEKAVVSGSYTSDAVTITCNKGLGSNSTDAAQGTWTGIAALN